MHGAYLHACAARTPAEEIRNASKIQNFLMNYQSHPKVIVKKHNRDWIASRLRWCRNLDGWIRDRLRDPELSKRWTRFLTKVGLMSPGACHTFPSFWSRFQRWCVVHNPRIPHVVRIQNSDEFALSIQPECSPFLFDFCDYTLSPTVSQLHTLPRAQGTTVSTDSFSRGYDPFTRAREGQASDWCWLTLSECVIVIVIVNSKKLKKLSGPVFPMNPKTTTNRQIMKLLIFMKLRIPSSPLLCETKLQP